jgi:hypothetical protein
MLQASSPSSQPHYIAGKAAETNDDESLYMAIPTHGGTDSIPCHYFVGLSLVVCLNYWEKDAEKVNNYVICSEYRVHITSG